MLQDVAQKHSQSPDRSDFDLSQNLTNLELEHEVQLGLHFFYTHHF